MVQTNKINKCSTDSEWIYVSDSSIHNKGIFAFKDIRKGIKVIQYTGKKIRKKDAEGIGERDKKNGTVCLFVLNRHFYIDGADSGSDAIYINHSCNPNCEILIENNDIWIVTLRKIKKGEELSFDYCFEHEIAINHPCKCGYHKCRKFIIDATDYKKFLNRKNACD